VLSWGPLAMTLNWWRFLLAIGSRLLVKLSKVCCSIESRTIRLIKPVYTQNQKLGNRNIEEETPFIVERVSPGLLDIELVSRFEILDGGVSASVEGFEILDLYQIRLK
jgi:hypothetical protein